MQPVSGLILPALDLVLTLAGGTLGVKIFYRDPVMRVLGDDF